MSISIRAVDAFIRVTNNIYHVDASGYRYRRLPHPRAPFVVCRFGGE
jgi:hypothetical protein